MSTGRREFLLAGAALGVGGACGRALLAAEAAKEAEEVSAVEDLMREHGVLRRILLIYEEFLRRLRAKADSQIPRSAFLQSVELVEKFVEDYHEKLEETYLFPELRKQDQFVPLVTVLQEQHDAGRALTKTIRELAASNAGNGQMFLQPELRGKIADRCRAFIRMYHPHAAREDTVLFPAFKKLLTPKQLDQLGDKFEDEENRRFGAEGFEKTVEKVAAIEKKLGIYELAQFTPKTVK